APRAPCRGGPRLRSWCTGHVPAATAMRHAQGHEELRDQPPTTRTHHTRDARPPGARGTARPALHTPAPGHRRVTPTAEGRPRGAANCANRPHPRAPTTHATPHPQGREELRDQPSTHPHPVTDG